jgi:plasmid maintenance system antidote protein VapI
MARADIRGLTRIPNRALRIGKFAGNGPALWLRLQQAYDLWDRKPHAFGAGQYRNRRREVVDSASPLAWPVSEVAPTSIVS